MFDRRQIEGNPIELVEFISNIANKEIAKERIDEWVEEQRVTLNDRREYFTMPPL
jgi:hypothetical protein